jgi:hypothetical protein
MNRSQLSGNFGSRPSPAAAATLDKAHTSCSATSPDAERLVRVKARRDDLFISASHPQSTTDKTPDRLRKTRQSAGQHSIATVTAFTRMLIQKHGFGIKPYHGQTGSCCALRGGDGSAHSRCRFRVLPKPILGTADSEYWHCFIVRSFLPEIPPASMNKAR